MTETFISYMKTVAAVIPIYKHHRFFFQSLESALKQTYPLNEIIIVDDGSNDPEIENTISLFQDSRIKLIRHSKNLGLAQARNTGAHVSNSEFLAFLDSDDYWSPDKISSQIELLQNEGEIVASSVEFKNPDGSSVSYRPNIDQQLLDVLFNNLFSFLPSSWILSKNTFQLVGQFDSQLRFAEDWEFLIRSAIKDIKIVSHPRVLVHMNVHDHNMSTCYYPMADVRYLIRKILKLSLSDQRISKAMIANALSCMARWMHLKHSFLFELYLSIRAFLISPTILKSKVYRGNVINMVFNR